MRGFYSCNRLGPTAAFYLILFGQFTAKIIVILASKSHAIFQRILRYSVDSLVN
jgi:hypothetical protein